MFIDTEDQHENHGINSLWNQQLQTKENEDK